MRVRVVKARELGSEDLERWRQIQRANPCLASPYFCPEFTQAVAAVRPDVFVGVLEDGGKTVGFFPFQRGWLGVGKPVGGRLSDYHGVIAPEGAEWRLEELVGACGLKTWDFDHLVGAQAGRSSSVRGTAGSYFMDLSGGFEAYVDSLRACGSDVISHAWKSLRQAERRVGPVRFEADAGEARATVLKTLLEWKSSQYRRSGLIDVFSFDWTVALLERILSTRTDGFVGALSALYIGDELAAVHMGMQSATVWHWWFPAHDPKFRNYSPGVLLRLKAAEVASARGIKTLDMGKGDTSHKLRLSSGAALLAEGCVEVRSIAGALRRLRRGAETWIRQSPAFPLLRIPGRLLTRRERLARFK